MMIDPNSLAHQKKENEQEAFSGGGVGRGRRSKKGRPNRNSDARRGRSHRSLSERGVVCEKQEKT